MRCQPSRYERLEGPKLQAAEVDNSKLKRMRSAVSLSCLAWHAHNERRQTRVTDDATYPNKLAPVSRTHAALCRPLRAIMTLTSWIRRSQIVGSNPRLDKIRRGFNRIGSDQITVQVQLLYISWENQFCSERPHHRPGFAERRAACPALDFIIVGRFLDRCDNLLISNSDFSSKTLRSGNIDNDAGPFRKTWSSPR